MQADLGRQFRTGSHGHAVVWLLPHRLTVEPDRSPNEASPVEKRRLISDVRRARRSYRETLRIRALSDRSRRARHDSCTTARLRCETLHSDRMFTPSKSESTCPGARRRMALARLPESFSTIFPHLYPVPQAGRDLVCPVCLGPREDRSEFCRACARLLDDERLPRSLRSAVVSMTIVINPSVWHTSLSYYKRGDHGLF